MDEQLTESGKIEHGLESNMKLVCRFADDRLSILTSNGSADKTCFIVQSTASDENKCQTIVLVANVRIPRFSAKGTFGEMFDSFAEFLPNVSR